MLRISNPGTLDSLFTAVGPIGLTCLGVALILLLAAVIWFSSLMGADRPRDLRRAGIALIIAVFAFLIAVGAAALSAALNLAQ